MLFELGDHSHDEIAEVLGVRRDKVKALVFQARESLAGWRRARETPCVEVREQLATARGAAFKRAALRRHVARCEGCAEFETEVRRQRSAMALLLPVVPTAGLKAAVLGAAGIGGAGAGAGGGSLAGLGAAKGLAAKTMLCAAVAGSAGSAGYVAVHEVQMHDARGDVPAAAAHARTAPARAPRVERRPQAGKPGRARPRRCRGRGGAEPSHAAGAGRTHGRGHHRRDGSATGRAERERGRPWAARGPSGTASAMAAGATASGATAARSAATPRQRGAPPPSATAPPTATAPPRGRSPARGGAAPARSPPPPAQLLDRRAAGQIRARALAGARAASAGRSGVARGVAPGGGLAPVEAVAAEDHAHR